MTVDYVMSSRAYGWTGQDNYLKFAAETAGECLHQMKLYTGIDFPINKCDNVGLPQFPAGAMENYGLILYKYQLIPYNEDTMTTLERVEAARVICHEVSHQWYGDLVTARWWDNLFLNEGFAAYYMRYLMGKSFPDDADFVDSILVSLDREQALKQDAGPTTHPLIAPDGPYFDTVKYRGVKEMSKRVKKEK
ncbi:peptidase family M1 [Ancylostoma duodenale]|uniref:Peptidase family M1 n=1 Tax=Ancylostoma duodenale TaxID=51022 RepID=A0A0C2GDM6_9BILA|nr:peptidase family M1 [Ancylostoma duodenale]